MRSAVSYIFESIEAADKGNKEELRRDACECVNKIIAYYYAVVNEAVYYSATPAEKLNTGMVKSYDERRREAHDDCILACARLNEICDLLGISKLCNFNTNDRRRVARFCGSFVRSLYYGNIACDG